MNTKRKKKWLRNPSQQCGQEKEICNLINLAHDFFFPPSRVKLKHCIASSPSDCRAVTQRRRHIHIFSSQRVRMNEFTIIFFCNDFQICNIHCNMTYYMWCMSVCSMLAENNSVVFFDSFALNSTTFFVS